MSDDKIETANTIVDLKVEGRTLDLSILLQDGWIEIVDRGSQYVCGSSYLTGRLSAEQAQRLANALATMGFRGRPPLAADPAAEFRANHGIDIMGGVPSEDYVRGMRDGEE